MSSGDDWNDPYWDNDPEESEMYCDYGCAEFCLDPFLRGISCCFECEAYQEAVEIEAGVYDFAFFWAYIDYDCATEETCPNCQNKFWFFSGDVAVECPCTMEEENETGN